METILTECLFCKNSTRVGLGLVVHIAKWHLPSQKLLPDGDKCSISSVAQSCPTLQPHGLQHARLPRPSPTPGAFSNSCPSSWWCHPTISSSVVPSSSCLQSFPASEYIIRHHKCGKWILPQAVCEQSEDKAMGSRKDFSGRHGILFYIRGWDVVYCSRSEVGKLQLVSCCLILKKKVVLQHSHAHLCLCIVSLAAFRLQQ